MAARAASHVSSWRSTLSQQPLQLRCSSSTTNTNRRAAWSDQRSTIHTSRFHSIFGGSKTPRSSRIAASDPAAASAPASAQPLAPLGEQVRDHSLDPFRELVKDKRFHCTQCGKCCTGSGEVWVSDQEAAGIAAFLEVGLPQFYIRYTKPYKKYKGWHLLKNKLGRDQACIFLQEDNKCGVHSARPGQCSTYPWWPDLMERPRWDWEKENICEGFDHAEATEVDVEEAAKQLRQATTQEQLRMLSSPKGPRPPAAA